MTKTGTWFFNGVKMDKNDKSCQKEGQKVVKTLQMRVVRNGEILGVVDTLSVWKQEVLYCKYDKFGCPIGNSKISKLSEVDLEITLDGQNWYKAQAPAVDDSAILHACRTARGAV
jgi:hypothetical protein